MEKSISPIRRQRQMLTAADFLERGVTFITHRPDIGLMAELTEPLPADEQRQLTAFMATINILADAKARARAARGMVS